MLEPKRLEKVDHGLVIQILQHSNLQTYKGCRLWLQDLKGLQIARFEKWLQQPGGPQAAGIYLI